MTKLFTSFFLLILLVACNQPNISREKNIPKKPVETITKPVLIKGKVTSAGIFSYYLPNNYSDTGEFPVIFIFDSHGDGNLPLNNYFTWAEQYGFILVGSNVSKNGLPQNQLENIIKQFFRKVFATFSIDKNRIYVMGFSGGARVSSIAAIEQQDVRGMILCGGGLAYRNFPQNKKMDILLFAGYEDFNMVELMNLDTLLSENNYRHQLILFNGHHQWPHTSAMKDGFLWILFNEMKDSIIPVNKKQINQFITVNEQKIKAEKNVFLKYLLLEKIETFADGLVNIQKYRNQRHALSNSAKYQKQLKSFHKIIMLEQQQEQSLVQDMGTQSFEWWKNKVAELSQDTGSGTMIAKSHMRILNYLSLVAYMQCDNALKNHRHNVAGHFIALYQLIDPENSDSYYMEAQLDIQENDMSAAITALQKAVDLGFDDFNRMQNEQVFSSLYNNPEFETLLDKIRK